MENIIKKMGLSIMYAASGLMILFLLIDFGVFGLEVKISNMYYLFMLVLFTAGLLLYKNRKKIN